MVFFTSINTAQNRLLQCTGNGNNIVASASFIRNGQTPAIDLIALGYQGIVQNFDSFMTKWTGLEAAHQAQGITRANLTAEDKMWMLETLTGQNVYKSAIEAANDEKWRIRA